LSGADKDVVYIPDDRFSLEIKTSSSPNGIFGNRSYAQPTQADKKSKSGYYLAVNFAGFDEHDTALPSIRLIRLGWLDHSDWVGQKAESGQQSHPNPAAKKHKLLRLYPSE
jgi:ScaI restriction endonuclease